MFHDLAVDEPCGEKEAAVIGHMFLMLVDDFFCSRENPVPSSCDHLQNSAVALRHQQLSEVLSLKNSSPVYTYCALTFLLSLTTTCFHFTVPYSSWLRGTVMLFLNYSQCVQDI